MGREMAVDAAAMAILYFCRGKNQGHFSAFVVESSVLSVSIMSISSSGCDHIVQESESTIKALRTEISVIPTIGTCRPGLFRIMRTRITRTGCGHQPWHTYSIRCSDKILSATAHQMQHSQVLPGYPHTSVGAYVPNCDLCNLTIA